MTMSRHKDRGKVRKNRKAKIMAVLPAQTRAENAAYDCVLESEPERYKVPVHAPFARRALGAHRWVEEDDAE